MPESRRKCGLRVETMESRVVPAGVGFEPGLHAAAMVADAVATPMVTRDTIKVRNDTRYRIEVTAHLNVQGTKPITRKIDPGGKVDTFSFGRDVPGFIRIDVKRIDANRPPQLSVDLPEPPDGYRGQLFTVSEFGDYFRISG